MSSFGKVQVHYFHDMVIFHETLKMYVVQIMTVPVRTFLQYKCLKGIM